MTTETKPTHPLGRENESGTTDWPTNPLDRLELSLHNRGSVMRRTGFTGMADDYAKQLAALQDLRRLAQPLADIARLKALYEGPPCNRSRIEDEQVVCYQQHGDTEVEITLGQCRAVEKLLKSP
jgi:hypothetical protein